MCELTWSHLKTLLQNWVILGWMIISSIHQLLKWSGTQYVNICDNQEELSQDETNYGKWCEYWYCIQFNMIHLCTVAVKVLFPDMLSACVTLSYFCVCCVVCAFCFYCVCARFSPCGSLIRDFQAVQVGLRPAAAPLLQLVDVAGQEGPCSVAGWGMSLAVMLRVLLIGCVVGVFKATVLVSNCKRNKINKDKDGSRCVLACSNPVRWLMWTLYLEGPAQPARGCSGEFWTYWGDSEWSSSWWGLRMRFSAI